jgi:hypothetical protein
MQSGFTLDHAVLTLSGMRYDIPGAALTLDGLYTLDGTRLAMTGHVRTQAEASQMVTGWKSLLLRPLDGLLRKNGAGLDLPIRISGTGDKPQVGLNF